MIILVVIVFIFLVKEWFSAEITAMCALFACICAGILPISASDPSEASFVALKVFSHPAPLTIACMFIVSAALEKTGVIDVMGDFFERKAAKTEIIMLLSLVVIAGVLSAFMSNTPVVVVFMPMPL